MPTDEPERLTAVLARLANFASLITGGRLAALRRLFTSLLHHSNLVDADKFALALQRVAADPASHPAIGEAMQACAVELRRRAPAGWTPSHVTAALREHVPTLFEDADGDGDDDDDDDGAHVAETDPQSGAEA